MERPLRPPFTIRPVEPRDLPGIAEIGAASSPWAARWSSESYLCVPGGERWAHVAESAHRVVGFILARWTAGEMEILNVAVAPAERRHGLARALAQAALREGAARGAGQAFLEVRESNAAALAFYAQLGFRVTGRRTRYYRDPDEDALLLARALQGLR